MQISPDKIAEVLERIDIVELISRNVKLRRTGGNYVGLCPFHAEKTGSFNVNPQRRFFKCFGCDAAGDAISFVRKMQGISFIEAVRQLAAEAGVDLDEKRDAADELRAKLFQATSAAQRKFEYCLWNDPRAQAGRDHLAKRGVTQEMARLFGLGYAPLSWDELSETLRREGLQEWAAQVGLLGQRQSGNGYYDMFRGRLTIPIRSAEGRNIAFGARLIESSANASRPGGGKDPKYLNTKESPLYRKFDTLYGLDMAREGIRKKKSAVVVEGYFDVIGLYAAGVTNAVALCSTALTAGHLAVLDRLGAQNILMLLDGDAAGFGAVRRLSGSLLATGKTIQVATLPDGEDPDEYALREGPEAVERFLETAPTLSRHLLATLLPRGRAHSTEEKMAGLRELRSVLNEIPAGLAKSSFISDIASHIGVQDTEVRAYLREDPSLRRKPSISTASARHVPDTGMAQAGRPPSPHECLLAALLLEDSSLAEDPAAQAIDESDSIQLRLMVQTAQADAGGDAQAAPGGIDVESAVFREVQRQREAVRTTLTDRFQRQKALRDASKRIRLQRIESLLEDTKSKLVAALQGDADDEDIEALQENHRALNAQRLQLQKMST